jgi:hypothetical protein
MTPPFGPAAFVSSLFRRIKTFKNISMEKINKNLKQAAKNKPGEKFKVLIVVKEGSDLKKLSLNQSKKLMDNMVSASLEGKEVEALAQNEDVISIEEDQEMGIM